MSLLDNPNPLLETPGCQVIRRRAKPSGVPLVAAPLTTAVPPPTLNLVAPPPLDGDEGCQVSRRRQLPPRLPPLRDRGYHSDADQDFLPSLSKDRERDRRAQPIGNGLQDAAVQMPPPGVIQILNWGFRTPVDQSQPIAMQEAEELLRQLERQADALYQWVEAVAGEGGRAVTPESLWVGGDNRGSQAISAITNTFRTLGSLALDSEEWRKSTAKQMNSVFASAVSPLMPSAPGNVSVPTSALSAPAAPGGKPQSGVDKLMAMIAVESNASGQGTATQSALPQWLVDKAQHGSVDSRDMMLWMLTRPEPLDTSKLKLLEMLTSPQTTTAKQLDERKALLDYASKLQEFFRQSQQPGFSSAAANLGMLFLSDDMRSAMNTAHASVQRESRLPEVAMVQLMTHQYVRQPFARLVAKQLHYNDIANPRRLSTGVNNDLVIRELHAARTAFQLMYWGHNGQLMMGVREPMQYIGQVQRVLPLHSVQSQLQREHAEREAYRYAQTHGHYFTGRYDEQSSDPFAAPARSGEAARYRVYGD